MMPTLIKRDDWLKGLNLSPLWRPSSFQSYQNDRVKGATIHWPGGNVAGQEAYAYIRGMQMSYRKSKSRGYDLGYNYVVPHNNNDIVFEARGTFKSAAQNDPNLPGDENAENVAIQLQCNLDGNITPSQIERARWVIATIIRNKWPKATRIAGHRDVDRGTTCPGDKIWNMVHNGVFEPKAQPQPEKDEEGQYWIQTTDDGYIFLVNGITRHEKTVHQYALANGLLALGGKPPNDLIQWPKESISFFGACVTDQ